ncbi:hypothetical protein JCM16303_006317 [Sporobolomyces ruberrimus]
MDPDARAQTPLLQYFSSVKPEQSTSTCSTSSIKPKITRPPQYSSLTEATKELVKGDTTTDGKRKELNKAIRKTLGKEDNPVTNSTSYGRTMHIQSCATGHQGGGGGKGWALHRYAKLALQAADKETLTLKGVIACISGYTGPDSTNLELIECVQRQGGRVMITPNGSCTHIFSTSNLSGSKAQKYFESNKKNKYKLVLPEWAYECERVGKRVSESKFVAPIKHEAQSSIFEIYGSNSTTTSSSAAALLSSTSTSSHLNPNPKTIASTSTLSVSDKTTIVLSPSPSPNSPQIQKKRKSKAAPSTKSPKKKHRSSSSSSKSPEKTVEKKLEKKKERIEELLILGSSDVEIEDPNLASALMKTRPSKEVRGKKDEADEVDDLDEFGIPPSAQRR